MLIVAVLDDARVAEASLLNREFTESLLFTEAAMSISTEYTESQTAEQNSAYAQFSK